MSRGTQTFADRAIDVVVVNELAAADRDGAFSDLPNFGKHRTRSSTMREV